MGGAELVGGGGMSNSNTLDAHSQSIAPYQGDLPQPQPAPGVSQQTQAHAQEQAQTQGPVAGPRPEGQFGPMASFDEAWAQQQNWNSGAPPSVPERSEWALAFYRSGDCELTQAWAASKKRSTPVDLTGDDEDEDMKRALQASIESETDRQKRHQTYPGFEGAGAGAAGMGASHGPHPLRTVSVNVSVRGGRRRLQRREAGGAEGEGDSPSSAMPAVTTTAAAAETTMTTTTTATHAPVIFTYGRRSSRRKASTADRPDLGSSNSSGLPWRASPRPRRMPASTLPKRTARSTTVDDAPAVRILLFLSSVLFYFSPRLVSFLSSVLVSSSRRDC